ncbi:CrcB protein [Duganella sp. 1224]|uniref:CrcB family protein n=1 Tax=Duganella sp. 1224 TaxID=2587052 RepID=UPI0015C7AD02|nr:CrcB family protein [Duganella sp. 1224]NYE60322.1 CrcB protein [Duganella sp. 1224]
MNDAAYAILAAGAGAMLGPPLRYGLSLPQSRDVAQIAVNALLVNLVAAYFVGAAAGVFDVLNLPPPWKLLFIAVLSAVLSAFSTFSAELLARLRERRLGWSSLLLLLHVAGSLVMTVAGIASVSLLHGPGTN